MVTHRSLIIIAGHAFTVVLLLRATATRAATMYRAQDEFRIACGGGSGNLTDEMGRTWMGDGDGGSGKAYLNLDLAKDVSVSASDQNTNLPGNVPYLTARIFTSLAIYSFPVSPGRHWIRLYFYPFATQAYHPNDAIVTVLADSYRLMTNVSLTQELAAYKLAYLYREFSLNLTSGTLSLSFIPGTASGAYAMVNGIEVLSMPDDIFATSLKGVGLGNAPFLVAAKALQTIHRLNVGGQAILASNDELGREWVSDLPFIPTAAEGVACEVTNPISYGTLASYIAPEHVYQTARTMTNNHNVNFQFNLTWNFSVDPNFTYHVRLHFCEIQYTRPNQRVFDIFLNGQIAQSEYDVVVAAGKAFTATILDFALPLQGSDSAITLQLHPTNSTAPFVFDSILNGLEIFKMSHSTGNLQGPRPSVPVNMPVVPDFGKGSSSKKTSMSSNKTSIIGGVAGSLGALAAIAVIFLCFRMRRKEGDGGKSPPWLPFPVHGWKPQSIMMSKVSTASKKSGTCRYVSSAPPNLCRHFSFAEIIKITNNFDESRVIGVGGFGKVYKGILEVGTEVAVKRANPCSAQGVTEFQTEIELLSKLRHRHLVSLMGFCEEHSEMILVYDYMANGPLRRHLYGAGLPSLSWKQRLDICIGAAKGLHYLHTGATHGIIHRDVKTTNILLDENFVAKVSDFGLSKTRPTLDHTHVSTAVKGTFGYLDPEYFHRQQLTEKSDVYSFGVVLLEVLLARPAIDPTLLEELENMAEWAMQYQKEGMLDQIVDPFLKDRISKDSLEKFAETAEKCLAESGLDRPTMGDVLWNLEYALQLHEPGNMDPGEIDNSLENSHSVYSDKATASDAFSELVNPQGR